MTPLKQRTPGGDPGHTQKIYEVINGKDNSCIISPAQSFTCRQCAFYGLITRKSGYKYGLCHFTGAHDPQPGQNGCRFIAGTWSRIDEILGLTDRESINSLEIPKVERLADSLCNAQHCGNSGFFHLCHFRCPNRHEYKLAVQRPEPARAGGLSTTGERCAAFLF